MAVTALARIPRNRRSDTENESEGTGRWQGHDNIFFHRSQVTVGTRIVNFGRVYHGEVWTVIEIRDYYKSARSGEMRTRRVNEVIKLTDDLVLRSDDRNITRQVSFGTLSYSAIWRLAP